MGRTRQETARIWRQRIQAAEAFKGSIEAYCRQKGIQSSSFYSWRRRLAAEEPKKPSVFVPAVVTAPGSDSQSQVISQMPDAKWVADVLSHLLRGLK